MDATELLTPSKYCIFYCKSSIKGANTHFISSTQLCKFLEDDQKKELSNIWHTYPTFLNNQLFFNSLHPIINKQLNNKKEEESYISVGAMTIKNRDILNNSYSTTKIYTEFDKKKLFKRFSNIEEKQFIENFNINIEKYCTQPRKELIYEWESGDLMIISNLTLLHKANNKTQSSMSESGLRLLYRICIESDNTLLSLSNTTSISLTDIPIVKNKIDSGSCIVGNDFQEIYINK